MTTLAAAFLLPFVQADEAVQALKKAVAYYRTTVAVRGGYVYYTSEDLRDRWGEGRATPDQIWVQPPGTPAVGLAYLAAWRATKDPVCLEAAVAAARALVDGQLESGGWQNHVDFGPAPKHQYRTRKGGRNNNSSFDDGQTQTALRFMMAVDEALDFKDAAIHEAAQYGLSAVLKAQFPNGAFPQVFRGPAPHHPVVPAKLPDYDWRTEKRVKEYWDLYTLNDGLAGTLCETLLEAHRIYKDEKARAALVRLGEFLILAQMPSPQRGWAQQYTYEMCPAWARKFEPPAISGGEGQDAMETLLAIHRLTGEARFLEPVKAGLAYYRACLLPDGGLARYYELGTNKPLYMTSDYRLTNDDRDVPSHYAFKVKSRLDAIEKEMREGPEVAKPPSASEVARIVKSLDAQGRWVSTAVAGESLVGQPKFPPGMRYLSSAVFARNVESLSAFVAASRPK
ncbi:MAG TPA: pectate lyase [Planctomycetota bacterium]|nr:pectate lyase [Planctomycetota bacterium]